MRPLQLVLFGLFVSDSDNWCFVLALVSSYRSFSPRTRQSCNFDLVITNARIVDGTGNPWFRADVGIKDGRIARIGRIDPAQAPEPIDAKGPDRCSGLHRRSYAR